MAMLCPDLLVWFANVSNFNLSITLSSHNLPDRPQELLRQLPGVLPLQQQAQVDHQALSAATHLVAKDAKSPHQH
jgi:hypothetical protein